MTGRRWFWYLAALTLMAAVVTGVMVGRRRPQSGQDAPAVARETPGPAGTDTPQVPRPALTPTRIKAHTHRPGARTAIPRLLPATTGRGAPDPTPAGPPAQLRPATRPLTDRRPDPGPGSEAMKAEIMRRLQLADDASNLCLQSWAGIDPTLEKGVRMRFTLDADGLDQVFLEDRADVPAGPLACLSEAIYQQDWSGLTEAPLQITRTLTAEPAPGPGQLPPP
jgi:hypothetical protein